MTQRERQILQMIEADPLISQQQIANALGIMMDERDIEEWDRQLMTLSCHGMSSTLQDIRARRKTEVELYGGEICQLGCRLGVPTPENERLVARIKEIEGLYL